MIKKLIYVDTRVSRAHACLGFLGKRLSEAPQLCGVDGHLFARDILQLLTALRYEDYFSFPLWEYQLIALVSKEIIAKKIYYRLGSVPKYRQFTQMCSPFLLRIQRLW